MTRVNEDFAELIERAERPAIMKGAPRQLSLWDPIPAEAPETTEDKARRALDDLFNIARSYTKNEAYRDLLKFICRFRFCAPYNALLLHVQMPGATYVATASDWLYKYGRRIKVGARALVILRMMGPVDFVFDVSDTEPAEDRPSLPPDVDRPYAVGGRLSKFFLDSTVENAKRDGVAVVEAKEDRRAPARSAPLLQAAISMSSRPFVPKSGISRFPCAMNCS
ncbi:MAG TPA: hypothetical protein VFJ58_11685 [Armatimonadota bacterium]|nr:hypothetical protein [Armatimonadota bacterium]